MRHFIILFFLLSCIFSSVFSQEESTYFPRLVIKPTLGGNIPLSKFRSGEISDNLILFADNSRHFQPIGITFYIKPKWGIEFSHQLGSSPISIDRNLDFQSEIEEIYGNDYFVSASTPYFNSGTSIFTRDFSRTLFGIVYRIEKDRFIIMPKLSAGTTTFTNYIGEAIMKQRGTNSVLSLEYDPGDSQDTHFTVAPAVTFAFRLSKRFVLNLDAQYSFFQPKIEYREEIRDIFKEEVTGRRISYSNTIHSLTIAGGVSIEIWHSKLY